MKRAIVLTGVVVLLVSLVLFSVHGATWTEERAGVQFRIDPNTGQTQAGFYLFMKYTPVPECLEIIIEWSVYLLDNPQVPLVTAKRRIRRNCGGYIALVSTLSPFITPVAGHSYGARIIIHDVENNLIHERVITYTAPLSLPTGIAYTVTTPTGISQGIDFDQVSDEELDLLAGYFNTLSVDYVQTASDILLADFFSTSTLSAPPVVFPVWVWVVANVGSEVNVSGGGVTIRTRHNRILFLYSLESSIAVIGVLDQLAQFDQEFIGRVLLRKEGVDGLAAATIFVGEDAWKILEAAAEEWNKD